MYGIVLYGMVWYCMAWYGTPGLAAAPDQTRDSSRVRRHPSSSSSSSRVWLTAGEAAPEKFHHHHHRCRRGNRSRRRRSRRRRSGTSTGGGGRAIGGFVMAVGCTAGERAHSPHESDKIHGAARRRHFGRGPRTSVGSSSRSRRSRSGRSAV